MRADSGSIGPPEDAARRWYAAGNRRAVPEAEHFYEPAGAAASSATPNST